MNSPMLPKDLMATIGTAIHSLRDAIPAALGCVVATVDGRLLDHVVSNDADPQRIAAMVGAMVALGETIGREVRIDRAQYVVVHALNGLLLMQRVPSRKQLLVVATLANPTTNLGIVLHETRNAAQTIGEALDAWTAMNAARQAEPRPN